LLKNTKVKLLFSIDIHATHYAGLLLFIANLINAVGKALAYCIIFSSHETRLNSSTLICAVQRNINLYPSNA